MPARAEKTPSRKASGGSTQRVLHLRLDAETAEALARLTSGGRPATDAARDAIRGWAGLGDSLAAQAAGIARIEARLAAGGGPLSAGTGPVKEPPAACAALPPGIQPGDTAWLPDNEQ